MKFALICGFLLLLGPDPCKLAWAADDGTILPFPPAPSASIAAPTLKESKHARRVEPNHLPEGAPNILIVLMDDVGFGVRRYLRRSGPYPYADQLRDEGIAYNHLPHHRDLLSDARSAADGPQSPSCRLGHDCRTCRRLGWLYRCHPQDLRRPWPKSSGTTATRPRHSASGTTRPRPRPRQWDRSTAGRPAMASSISTASLPARPRNGSRGWWKTRC